MLTLPAALLAHSGAVTAWDRPGQGDNYETYFLTSRRGRFVLKIGRTPDKAAALGREFNVLRRLADCLPNEPREGLALARPVAQAEQDGAGWFLFTYLEGDDIVDALPGADEAWRHHLIREFARTLRRIHACTPDMPRPADWLGSQVRRVAEDVRRGRIAGPIRQRGILDGADPRALVRELTEWHRTAAADLVFCHGDYCLPNVLVRDGAACGVIDWGDGGYADRRFDLGTALRTVRRNLGSEDYVETFLRAYATPETAQTLRPFEILYVLSG